MGSPDPVTDLTAKSSMTRADADVVLDAAKNVRVSYVSADNAALALSILRARNTLDRSAPVTNSAAGFTTVAGCIELGENNLNLVPEWHEGGEPAAAAKQSWFIDALPAFRALARTLPLKGIFAGNADEINSFLAIEGFSIKLKPLRENEYGMASVLKLASQWEVAGTETTLEAFDGNTYAAANLHSVTMGMRVEGHEPPVVIIPTQNEVRYLVTELDHLAAVDGPDLFTAAQALFAGFEKGQYVGCEGLTFPKVSLDVQPDIGYLIGLKTVTRSGQVCRVTQAVQQIKLEMDHLGARVEEASAMAMGLECVRRPKPPIELKRPFLVAVLVPVDGKLQVALAFRVGPDAWTRATAASVEDEGGSTPE